MSILVGIFQVCIFGAWRQERWQPANDNDNDNDSVSCGSCGLSSFGVVPGWIMNCIIRAAFWKYLQNKHSQEKTGHTYFMFRINYNAK